MNVTTLVAPSPCFRHHVLHDTDKGVVICNSSRGDEIESSALQEYSWKIRILSLPRLCQTRGHEEVFLGFAQEVIVSCSLCTYLLGRYSRSLSLKWYPTNKSLLYSHPLSSQPLGQFGAHEGPTLLHGRRPSTSKRLRFRP